MEEIDVFKSMRESVEDEFSPFVDEKEAARLKLISDHKAWLKKIKKEHPSPYQFFKVGVYIRYFNQTKYENYLDYLCTLSQWRIRARRTGRKRR